MVRPLAIVLLLGCNQVYGLEATQRRDAAVFPDGDGDGVFDDRDNCPGIANPTQDDADRDLRGDVCDECPLLAGEQGGDADRDGVGDACDPHPDQAGDCLLLLDGFRDPAAFASHWRVTTADASVALPEPGRVVLRPAAASGSLQITESTIASALTTVTVLGRVEPQVAGNVSVLSSYVDASSSYGCVSFENQLAVMGPGPVVQSPVSLVPPEVVGGQFLLQTSPILRASTVDVSCRVDVGVSVATTVFVNRPRLGAGAAAVRVSSREAIVDAVALFAVQSGPCTTVYR